MFRTLLGKAFKAEQSPEEKKSTIEVRAATIKALIATAVMLAHTIESSIVCERKQETIGRELNKDESPQRMTIPPVSPVVPNFSGTFPRPLWNTVSAPIVESVHLMLGNILPYLIARKRHIGTFERDVLQDINMLVVLALRSLADVSHEDCGTSTRVIHSA